MKKLNPIMKNSFILLAVLILLISNVFGFAISSHYYKGFPLYLMPGEIRNVQLLIQNLAGADNITIKAKITDGKEIAKLTDSSDNIYMIPAGQNKEINMQITIPSNAKIKTDYPVGLEFISLVTGTSGGTALASSIGQQFDVIVGTGAVGENNISAGLIVLIIAAALAVGAVSYYLIVKKKRK